MMIQTRKQLLVNTDPQRRCYNGCHAKSELQWTAWAELCSTTSEKAEDRLKFWRSLNAYAVSQGREITEYRAI